MCSEEVAQESASAPNDTTVSAPDETRKKPASRAVRAPLPKNLPRQERIVALPTRECTCVQCFGSAQKAGWIGAFKLLRRRVVGVDVCGFFERLPALGRVAGRWSSGGWQDDQLERYSQSRCEVGFGCNDLRMFW